MIQLYQSLWQENDQSKWSSEYTTFYQQEYKV